MTKLDHFQRGEEVIVLVFGGKRVRRRVWEELSTSILVCKEEEYQRAIQSHEEATCTGIPKEDIVERHELTASSLNESGS